MSSKFDLELVVSKATSFASSSCTSDEDAGTGSLLVSFSAPFGGLPRNCSCPITQTRIFCALKSLRARVRTDVRFWHIADSLSPARRMSVIGGKADAPQRFY